MPNVILKHPGRNMIAVIKEVRGLLGLGLKESKDIVDAAAAGRPQVVLKDVNADRAQAALQALTAAGAQGQIEYPTAVAAAAAAGSTADQIWDSPAGNAGSAGATGGNGFAVELLESGKNKIAVIKAIRELTGLGLKEAKDMSEAGPVFVKQGLTRANADAACAKLIAEGARAAVR